MSSSAGDETQVNLALAQASCQDSGVYGCTITNEYGTDSTDFLLSAESMYTLTINKHILPFHKPDFTFSDATMQSLQECVCEKTWVVR